MKNELYTDFYNGEPHSYLCVDVALVDCTLFTFRDRSAVAVY